MKRIEKNVTKGNSKVSNKKVVVFGGRGYVGKTSMFFYYFKGEKNPIYLPVKCETTYGSTNIESILTRKQERKSRSIMVIMKEAVKTGIECTI